MKQRLLIIALATLMGATATLADWPVQPVESKPNIILIMVDDLGYGDITPYGQEKIHTPNLATLADWGMRFTQYYAGTSGDPLRQGWDFYYGYTDQVLAHNYYPQFLLRNGRLRGGKRELYEGGLRVPLIAYWPPVVEAGTTSDHISAAWDLLPTFCDIADLPTPECRDGISILPTLTGDGEQAKHESLYWEYHHWDGSAKQAVRMGDWKGIRFKAGVETDAPIQLFNLATDLGENNDLAEEHPGVAARIAEIMQTEHEPSELFPFRRAQ